MTRILRLLGVACMAAWACGGALLRAEELARVPIVYSTDLFHPHDDPDDHYDLATLFALDEFDLRGVILDQGQEQAKRSGRPAVEQLMHLTGRRVPVACGLGRRLRSRDDQALDAPAETQAGVELLLSVLRGSTEKVVLFTTGSCRDVAAAFNRQPGLVAAKVRAVYFNIGRGPEDPRQNEWNVGLDALSYYRLFESGLPLYWCPCFGKGGYGTHYAFAQPELIPAWPRPVQDYFVYCLSKSTADPIAFLSTGPHPIPQGKRNMWCTAPLLHAAGRKIYERGEGDFVALRPEAASRQRLADRPIEVFRFEPISARLVEPDSQAKPPAVPLVVDLRPSQPNGFVFRATDPRYAAVMTSCLKNLLTGLGRGERSDNLPSPSGRGAGGEGLGANVVRAAECPVGTQSF